MKNDNLSYSLEFCLRREYPSKMPLWCNLDFLHKVHTFEKKEAFEQAKQFNLYPMRIFLVGYENSNPVKIFELKNRKDGTYRLVQKKFKRK